MSIPYTVREGLAGLGRAKIATFASISAIVVSLILIGTFGLLLYYGHAVSDYMKQFVGEMDVFLEDVDETIARAMRDRAAAVPGVADARFISKEEAEQIFIEEFGAEGQIFRGEGFLPASIKVLVEPAYANLDSLNALSAVFSSWNRVDEVVFQSRLVELVQRNLRLISIFGLALGGVVLFAALFMVANTIRLTIYARRLLIRTMKLVGATDAFIRKPFLVEGVAQGLAAGVAAALLLWGLVSLLMTQIPQLQTEGWPYGTPLVAAGIVIAFGLLMGWLGSLFAVRRFIHRVELH